MLKEQFLTIIYATGSIIRFFWNVGKAFSYDGVAYVPLHKVGGFGEGFFTSNEGVLLKSPNLMTEKDPDKIEWQTLPDGDVGLRTPAGGGTVSAEHSFTVLSDGSFYSVYRSIDGYPVCSYSRDGGHTWSTPEYQKYADGRKMKNPRAANFAWKCENGKFLYWFHNHGGRFIEQMHKTRSGIDGLAPYNKCIPYDDRNPVWLCGGAEADSPEGKIIKWSQPEIVLYDDDPYLRMSYPDMMEDGGRIFLTETQKDKARVHPIPNEFLNDLWNQFSENTKQCRNDILLELSAEKEPIPDKVNMPPLPLFTMRDHQSADYGTKDIRAGFSIELAVTFDSLKPGRAILDTRMLHEQGLALLTDENNNLRLILNDGRTENQWNSDPDTITPGKLHHIVVTVDGGPKIITFIIDGKLCDGGEFRQFGWGRFSPDLRDANGFDKLRIGNDFKEGVHSLRIYGRYLTTSQAIANYRAFTQNK